LLEEVAERMSDLSLEYKGIRKMKAEYLRASGETSHLVGLKYKANVRGPRRKGTLKSVPHSTSYDKSQTDTEQHFYVFWSVEYF
jgi:hypothetical protein